MPTIIIGAGIIGVATAYYLSQVGNKEEIHLVEVSPQLFASASGNAGGFLARDWFVPVLEALGELSFDLHKELAEKHDGYRKWGYSPSSASNLGGSAGDGNGADWLREGVSRSTAAATSAKTIHNGPAWLKDRAALDVISDGSSTAQVDPLLLCRFLLDECLDRGVQLHMPARPISIRQSPSGTSASIDILNTWSKEKSTLSCTHLVLAAGPWTQEVHRTLFPESQRNIPITALAGHSLILRTPHWPPPKLDSSEDENPLLRQDCHAVFTTDTEGDWNPEMFSRMPDGHIYLAGLNSRTYPLPVVANQKIVDAKSIALLKKTARKLLGDDFEIVREGVCWRPVTPRGLPIIKELKEEEKTGAHVYIAAGHGPWGISNSLGTGFCVAGMIEGKDMWQYIGGLGLPSGLPSKTVTPPLGFGRIPNVNYLN